MRHHTATHIVIHAARQVLGEHIRQAGAQKGVESSRIDVRHYDRIDRGTVKRIEDRANEIVMDNTAVSQEWPDRHDAEAEYGFDLYQGGIPPGEQIPTDPRRRGYAGLRWHARRPDRRHRNDQDPQHRARARRRRADYLRGRRGRHRGDPGKEDALYEAAEILDVSRRRARYRRTVLRGVEGRGKQIEDLKEQLAEARAGGGGGGEEVDVGDTTAVVDRIDADMDELRATATAIAEEGKIAVLGSGEKRCQFVVAVPDDVGVNAGEVVGELAGRVGGGGGGPPDFAQGGGPNVEALDDALEDAPDVLRQVLNA